MSAQPTGFGFAGWPAPRVAPCPSRSRTAKINRRHLGHPSYWEDDSATEAPTTTRATEPPCAAVDRIRLQGQHELGRQQRDAAQSRACAESDWQDASSARGQGDDGRRPRLPPTSRWGITSRPAGRRVENPPLRRAPRSTCSLGLLVGGIIWRSLSRTPRGLPRGAHHVNPEIPWGYSPKARTASTGKPKEVAVQKDTEAA